jgi:sodium/hydrogen antiporter
VGWFWDWDCFGYGACRQEQAQEEGIQEAVDRFFTLYILVLLGLVLLRQSFLELGWKGLGLAIAVLLLRPLPVVLLLRPLLGNLKRLPDALFLGWLGSIGVAAVFHPSTSYWVLQIGQSLHLALNQLQ